MISPKLSVFISHSSLDSDISVDIYNIIKEQVAFTWLDQIELIPGTALLSRINEGIQQHIFKWAFVPGWTINEFPAFANTRTLAKMYENTLFNELFYLNL